MLYSLSIKLNISEALVFYSHRISKKKTQSWFNIYISNSCWNRQMFLFLQNLIFIIANRSLCLNFSILLWYALSLLPNKGKGEDTMSVLEEFLLWLGERKRCCGVLYPFLGCLGNSECADREQYNDCLHMGIIMAAKMEKHKCAKGTSSLQERGKQPGRKSHVLHVTLLEPELGTWLLCIRRGKELMCKLSYFPLCS